MLDEPRGEVARDAIEPTLEPKGPTEFTEKSLDCQGKRRTFRISELANGHFVVAQELPKANRTGLLFLAPGEPQLRPATNSASRLSAVRPRITSLAGASKVPVRTASR